MNRVVVNVPDEKMQAFEEAMLKLGIQKRQEQDYEIPEEHKNLVRRIIATTKPEDYRPWGEAMEEIRKDFEEWKRKRNSK